MDAKPVAQQPMTEMENHGAQLADSASRLSRLADRLEIRVNAFIQAPTALGAAGSTEGVKTMPVPQPGTLGSLQHYQREIDRAASRIDETLDKLSGIL